MSLLFSKGQDQGVEMQVIEEGMKYLLGSSKHGGKSLDFLNRSGKSETKRDRMLWRMDGKSWKYENSFTYFLD